jgi:hypothetical protein
LDDGCLQVAQQLQQHLGRLRTLDLSTNEIGDTGCRTLADRVCQHASLESLSLQNNRITDKGASLLAQAVLRKATSSRKGLKTVNLSNNQIGDAGCTEWAEVLQQAGEYNTVETLDLGDNFIGDEGAGTWVEVLDQITTLQHLDLSGNREISEARTRILDMLLKHRQRAPAAESSERSEREDDYHQQVATNSQKTSPLVIPSGGNTVYETMVQDLVQHLHPIPRGEEEKIDRETSKRGRYWEKILGFPADIFREVWTKVSREAEEQRGLP